MNQLEHKSISSSAVGNASRITSHEFHNALRALEKGQKKANFEMNDELFISVGKKEW